VWLELRYALRPLIYEVIQAIIALQTHISMERFTARGFHRVGPAKTSVEQVYTGLTTTGGNWDFRYKSETEVSQVWRAGVLSSIEADINGLMSIWGVDQPIETIWELTPFSFILDWFFTIGDVIGAWSPQAGFSTLSSWCTFIEKETTTVSLIGYDMPDGQKVNVPTTTYSGGSLIQAGSQTITVERKLRFPNPNRSIVPSLTINLDLFKGMDLALISRSILKGLI
jgi:hypothetical protein